MHRKKLSVKYNNHQKRNYNVKCEWSLKGSVIKITWNRNKKVMICQCTRLHWQYVYMNVTGTVVCVRVCVCVRKPQPYRRLIQYYAILETERNIAMKNLKQCGVTFSVFSDWGNVKQREWASRSLGAGIRDFETERTGGMKFFLLLLTHSNGEKESVRERSRK